MIFKTLYTSIYEAKEKIEDIIYTKYSKKKEEYKNYYLINPTTKNACYNKDKLSRHASVVDHV